jgi:hypothetical protein
MMTNAENRLLGLRVAKEDKYLNLSHRMSKKAKPAVSRKLAASKVVPPGDVNPVESATPSPETNPVPSPITTPVSPPPTAIPVSLPTNLIKSMKSSSKPKITASHSGSASQISVSPLLPSLQSMDLSSDSSDSEGDNSPIFDVTDTLTESSSFTLTESSSFGEDLDLLSLGYPVSDDKLRESFGPNFNPFPPALPEDPLFELDELQWDIPQISSMPVSVRDSLLPLDDLSRLSENDRIEFYNLINTGIGPAQGIEECAGTYKAHMESLYFDRFYPGAQPRSHYNHDDLCYSTTKAVIHTHPPTIVEKENINPRLSASLPALDSQPSNNYYRQTAVSSSPLRRNSHYAPLSPRREQPSTSATHPVKPFLLPRASNADKITANLPSREPMPHERPTPLIWTSPITSASSYLQTQQWQGQVLARTNPFAIPTFYSTSGDRIMYQGLFREG